MYQVRRVGGHVYVCKGGTILPLSMFLIYDFGIFRCSIYIIILAAFMQNIFLIKITSITDSDRGNPKLYCFPRPSAIVVFILNLADI
jgi:hypothetical protein